MGEIYGRGRDGGSSGIYADRTRIVICSITFGLDMKTTAPALVWRTSCSSSGKGEANETLTASRRAAFTFATTT
jgi:hypothetical protein